MRRLNKKCFKIILTKMLGYVRMLLRKEVSEDEADKMVRIIYMLLYFF